MMKKQEDKKDLVWWKTFLFGWREKWRIENVVYIN